MHLAAHTALQRFVPVAPPCRPSGVDGRVAEAADDQGLAGPDVQDVIAQEDRPRLPARAQGAAAAQAGLDGALGRADAQFLQFIADPLGPPERVLSRHPPEQGDGLRRERRAAWPRSRFPPPERAKAGAVPAQHRLWLDEEQRLPQVRTRPTSNNMNARSTGVIAGRLTFRRSTSSCWRRIAFSASS